ncbi:DUF3553 domain-containing protein [Geomonas subterranea]|uniref:DUF3553 domain-containing protein n=1 Tax=Geomonas subterranea TaxID=2847989 RepID=A0ABX8LLM5_9BACT|nr:MULTISPECIES: DUF3553 domain-containing protein [Geomonas]QXE92943.1 DUF3553 domain-containing protein [Geomonas subterranea]QXM08951.1 DUF3553 domain-containing protein [Geomonas subterranea]
MIVKRGSVVSHAMAQQWGIGKVVEVNDIRATIRFSDGMVRKIISSHFGDLHPADPAGYHPPVKAPPKGRGKAPRPKTARPKKGAAGATAQ